MQIVKGIYGEAKVFTDIVEETALEQVQNMMNSEVVAGTQVRFMPDIHYGKGATIGTAIRSLDGGPLKRINPEFVGVDLGCSVSLVKLTHKVNREDLPKLDEVINQHIPSGTAVHETEVDGSYAESFNHNDYYLSYLIEKLNTPLSVKDKERVRLALGTLGGGNHFIELLEDEEASYLAVHTGSRMLGARVFNYHDKIAKSYVDQKFGFGFARDNLIKKLKSDGKPREIQAAMQQLKSSYLQKDTMPYLEGTQLKDYLSDVRIASEYAKYNGALILEIILRHMDWEKEFKIHSPHNYIDTNGVLRKGASAAYLGDDVIIPINMKDGMLVGKGLGNPDWNFSAPHGAGRQLSRTKARSQLNLTDFKEEMSGIYTTSVVESTLDEAPEAYKPIQNILDNVKETVTIYTHLKPVYNFKAK